MDITIQSLHFTANPALVDFVNEKVAKLERYHKRALFADVVLSLDNASNGENKICEIKLGVPGNDLFAKRKRESFELAIVEVVEALERQIAEHKPEHKSEDGPLI